ncbi:LysR family transcriptional regulator [Marinomonas mediterranea]|nr:LysR family transcriptional regulator [Marinomonas mediterranea]WCN08224.1 LysR family transcriptional regulator [Marinomonas mediterranea]WCN12291.1 LysR family transcriptional regulator [Marinomonas mediterranea]WCN16363.1 LysR family transcriptional regulator [Marinomonas mediterranea MMB-1]
MYDLNDLQSFVMVMETENLTESARLLGVSKSTLSRRISHLEGIMGQPLLLRHANKMSANDAGRAFFPFAKKILDTAKQGKKTLEHLQDEVVGEVDVTVFSSFARSWFPNEVLSFLDKYPDASINVRTDSIFRHDMKSDVALWLGDIKETHLKTELLGNMSCGLYISNGFAKRYKRPETIRELEDLPWVNLHNLHMLSGELELRHSEQGMEMISIPRSRLASDQIGMQMEAIVSGNGVGILPDYMARRREKHHPGDLIRVFPEWLLPSLPMYLIYPYGHQPKRVQAFLQHIRDGAGDVLV